MQKINHYKLPSSGQARELLREKGQFWTPDWVAEAMVEYVLVDNSNSLFDPAVGAGAFFRAGKTIAKETGRYISLSGMEIDSSVLEQAIRHSLSREDIANVKIGDFIFDPPNKKFSAIVANPPYIRHHRISLEKKEQLKQLSVKVTGKILDGRAGLHIYFLVRALALLEENGRLAFIMSADTCEGKFSNDLWNWISKNYALDAVITFEPDASPFPNVDTNPIIFFLRKSLPQEKFLWVRCNESQTEQLKLWVRSGCQVAPHKQMTIVERELSEGLATGLSRRPFANVASKYVLGDFAQVIRGVATGANEFFFLTEEQIKRIGIPDRYFVRAIGRTRDVPDKEITRETLNSLDAKGRPTFLLALNGEPFDKYPEKLREYLKNGEKMGLPKRPLISQRKPWYKTESRIVPPFLFAYLGRRNSRFIRNMAGIIPLTGFLCVYPKSHEKEFIERLWKILDHPGTVSNLAMIGKSYGDGAVKVEPRSLEKLPIPDNVIEQIKMPVQMRLFEKDKTYKAVTYPVRKRTKTVAR